jgi:DNA (cytosine-5)-methyltransferase 1
MNVAYMFAGVGSVRLAFEYDCAGFSPDTGWVWNKREGSPWNFAWTNQYEPPMKKDRNTQHAYEIYVKHFGYDGAVNADIVKYLEHNDLFDVKVPEEIGLLVAGFPCQDFSIVNKTRKGIEGAKGEMWWQVHRLVDEKRPRFILLENVDNLLHNPKDKKGRDFAVLLASLRDIGYNVEWRVYRASDAGAATSRKRLYIIATQDNIWQDRRFFFDESMPGVSTFFDFQEIEPDILEVAQNGDYHFEPVGRMIDGRVENYRFRVTPEPGVTLGEILEPLDAAVSHSPHTIIPDEKLDFSDSPAEKTWNKVKGNLQFPDPLDQPARTLLTKSLEVHPMRENIVVAQERGGVEVDQPSTAHDNVAYRTLTAIEAERAMTFPDNWTKTSVQREVPRFHRGFVMGNSCPPVILERIRRSLEALIWPS